MNIERCKRSVFRIVLILALCSQVSLTAFTAEKKEGISIHPVRPGPIETKPSRTITMAVRVINSSADTHEFQPVVELPEGWRCITTNSGFVLSPQTSTVRLISFLVPLKALTGIYPIIYTVQAADDSALRGSLSVDIRVLLEAKLEIELLEAQQVVIAGEDLKARFVVSNRSNAQGSIVIHAKSTEDYPCEVNEDKIQLESGESETFDVIIETDPKIRHKIQHSLHFSASANGLGESEITEAASVRTEIIPLISGEGDYYQRFPTESKFIGFAGKGMDSVAQLEFSGSGEIPHTRGPSKIDFLFRGPGRTELLNFGLYREEYRLSIENDRAALYLGDGVFFLTKLSEYGQYGRGAQGTFGLGRFSIKSYYQESLFVQPSEKQTAVKLNFGAAEKLKLSMSYLSKSKQDHPEDDLFSLQAQYVSEALNINVEYALGNRSTNPSAAQNSAYWIELFGNFKNIFNYRLNRIRSEPGFPGSYSDMVFNSARISFSPLEKLLARLSYSDLRNNILIDPELTASQENYALLGLQYRLSRWADISLDYKQQTRTALFPDPRFDYADRSLRFGVSPHLGTLNLQGLVDIGITNNKLTGEKRRLIDMNASGSFTLFKKISLGGYFQWRNQDSDFTGDYERTMNINFRLKFTLGKTDVYAVYRKSMYYDFFERILFDHDLVEQLLYNHLDVFDVIIRQHLFNSHSISFRLRHASNASDRPGAKDEFIGLFEYSIPLGIPVGRNQEMGQLRGRVYDAENGKTGIAGVIVKVGQRVTVTNEDGRFDFYGLQAGPTLLNLEQRTLGPNRITAQETPIEIQVLGGNRTELDVAVVGSGRITGQAMVYQFADENKQEYAEKYGLSNSLIELKGEKTTLHRITDEHGIFRFDELRPGNWTLRIIDQAPQNHYIEKDTFDFEITQNSEEKILIKIYPVVRPVQYLKEGMLSSSSEGKRESLLIVPEYNEVAEPISGKKEASEYRVQVASCLFERSAAAIEETLSKDFKGIYKFTSKTDQETYHVVRIRADDLMAAEAAYEELKSRGYKPLIFKKKIAFTPISHSERQKEQPIGDEEHNGNGSFHFESSVSDNGHSSDPDFTCHVQVSSCKYKRSAENIKSELAGRYPHVSISLVENENGTYHVVKIPAVKIETAKKLIKELIVIGYNPIIKYE